MRKNRKMSSLCKLIGILCAAVMLVCALYVPLAFNVSAISSAEITDDVPFVSDFEDTVNNSALNEAEVKVGASNAPVTITFKNTIDGTESKVTGSAGDAITFPEDPVDPSGQSWFMGWYTDEAGTNKYDSNKFGDANITLYSFFKGEIPEINEGFENYTKDAYTLAYENGQACKSNRLYFGAPMSKQSEVTYNNSNYAVKFHWNPVQINDKNDINYYDTSRYNTIDNIIYLGTGLENNCVYVVSFKYKAEKVNAPVKFFALSANKSNIWASVAFVTYNNAETTIKQSDEWQEMSFQITTNMKANGDCMYLGIALTKMRKPSSISMM